MAKLYINKDITRESEKWQNWWFTGVEGITYQDINAFLQSVPADDDRIDVELYSCGGDCTEGFAIYDALRTCGKNLSATVVGEAASMATVILLAAPKEARKAFKHARFLIHEPYYPQGIYGEVDLSRLETLRAALESDKQKIVNIYVERTDAGKAKILRQMEAGDWFDTDTAMALGFIAETVTETSASAKSAPAVSTTKKPISKNDMNKKEKKNFVAKIIDAVKSVAAAEDEHSKALQLAATDGTTIDVETENNDIQVGDPASPEGTYTLDDGRTVTIQGGVITDIQDGTQETTEEQNADPDETADPDKDAPTIEELQKQIEDLQARIEELEKNQKTESENKVLEAVNAIGGIEALKKLPVNKGKIPVKNIDKGAQADTNPFQRKLDKLNKK